MEGKVWRKVLPEGAWRRRWHWSAPGHSWPSYSCPEFPRQARVWPWPQAAPRQGGQCGRHLSLVWPQAGPVWPPLSDQEEGSPSLAVPVSGAVSHPSCQLRTPHHWFPCSLVSSPCSLVSSPWSLVNSPCSLVHSPCSLVSSPCSLVNSPCSLVHSPCSLGSSPCSLVSSPCSLGGSPAHWLIPPAHWLDPPAHFLVLHAHWVVPLLIG